MPTTTDCPRCGHAYVIADSGVFIHACPDGKSVMAGTAWEPFDIYQLINETVRN